MRRKQSGSWNCNVQRVVDVLCIIGIGYGVQDGD